MKVDSELLPNTGANTNILKGSELKGVTYARIKGTEIRDFNGKKALQLTVSYLDTSTKQNVEKKFSIGKKKVQLLVDQFGLEMDNWQNKEILLVPTQTQTPDGKPTVAINVTPYISGK
jgi:hypothetical protein